MSIRNRSWKWLFVLGLIMALFLVTGSTEVRAGGSGLNITVITPPPSREHIGWVEGTLFTANGPGGTPTFTVSFIDAESPGAPLPGTVLQTIWITSTQWKLQVEAPHDLPNGHYNVRVKATYPNGSWLMDTSTPGQGTPDCSNTWCNCPC
jgi:hypothetical protein